MYNLTQPSPADPAADVEEEENPGRVDFGRPHSTSG
jgi:hypothetical protein